MILLGLDWARSGLEYLKQGPGMRLVNPQSEID